MKIVIDVTEGTVELSHNGKTVCFALSPAFAEKPTTPFHEIEEQLGIKGDSLEDLGLILEDVADFKWRLNAPPADPTYAPLAQSIADEIDNALLEGVHPFTREPDPKGPFYVCAPAVEDRIEPRMFTYYRDSNTILHETETVIDESGREIAVIERRPVMGLYGLPGRRPTPKPRKVTINGTEMTINRVFLGYRDVCRLAGQPDGASITFFGETYEGVPTEGILSRGQVLVVMRKMHITCVVTGAA